MDIQQEILKYPLHVLKWCGQNPKQSRISYLSFATIFVLFGSIEVVLIFLQFFYANGDINVIAQNIEGMMAFTQIIGKFLISAIKLEDFRKIIDDTKKFWSVEMCTGNVQKELENNMKRTLQLEKLFVYMMICSAVLITVSSVLLKQLPTGFWIMKDYNLLFTLALVIQQAIAGWAGVYTAAYDGLFLSLCVSLQTQFKTLHYCLKDLDASIISSKADEEMYLNKLISYVRHHEFLLRFSKDMKNIYSLVMLVVCSTILLMYCAEMYMVFESKHIFLIARSLFLMTCLLILFSFYCIPLNYVTDEAISVSQGIYESNWYPKYIPASRRFITLIIQRSQQDIIFTAGGLIEMNCGTMLRVIRMSYSVCTIMRALKNV